MVPDSFDGNAIAVYGALLKQALCELRSSKATPGQRTAWARIAECTLRQLPEAEERIAETLATAVKVLNEPMFVHRLVEGVWACTDDKVRMRRWVTGLADKAIRGEHWATFAELAYTAARFDAIEQQLPSEWDRALRAAHEDPDAWVSLYMFTHEYAAKFIPNNKAAPGWLHVFASDRRLHDAVEDPARTAGRSWCPLCERMGYR